MVPFSIKTKSKEIKEVEEGDEEEEGDEKEEGEEERS
jgi:hypothetical protein